MPSLKWIDGILSRVSVQNNPELTLIDLHSFNTPVDLLIGTHNELITIDLASLETVSDIVIWSDSLQHLDLSSLREVLSNVEFSVAAPLVLPRLEIVDFLGIAGGKTPKLELPALIELNMASIFNNEELMTIDMPSLTTVHRIMDIHDNPALTNMSMPALINCSFIFKIKNNASLCASVVDSVLDQWRDDELCILDIAGNRSGC